MATTKKTEASTFRVMVGVRLTPVDAERLEALADRIPIASRHAIAREALRIGLDVLERDPARLVERDRRQSRAKRAK